MPTHLKSLLRELHDSANPAKAKSSLWFFKTGPGQYGEGDKFWGITVPVLRKLAKKYIDLTLPEVQKLLENEIHEQRLVGALILTYQFEKAPQNKRKEIFNFYIKNRRGINNWDIVDLSVYKIVGRWIYGWPTKKRTAFLKKLALSKNLWDRRIAIISTFYLLQNNQPQDTLALAKILLNDEEDLMHKATGWMLREVGKRCSEEKLDCFLLKNHLKMPRTMLRYAIERFPEEKRRWYIQSTTQAL